MLMNELPAVMIKRSWVELSTQWYYSTVFKALFVNVFTALYSEDICKTTFLPMTVSIIQHFHHNINCLSTLTPSFKLSH